MRILILSDSHSGLSYMRNWIERIRPQVLIHLGDYYADGQEMAEEFPQCRMIQVPGNCDMYRCAPLAQDTLFSMVDGVSFFLTHGHRYGVKSGTGKLLAAAREARADAVLYGHTHAAECYRDGSGMWVMNPGTCSGYGGSVGLVEIRQGKIVDCRILWAENMAEFD